MCTPFYKIFVWTNILFFLGENQPLTVSRAFPHGLLLWFFLKADTWIARVRKLYIHDDTCVYMYIYIYIHIYACLIGISIISIHTLHVLHICTYIYIYILYYIYIFVDHLRTSQLVPLRRFVTPIQTVNKKWGSQSDSDRSIDAWRIHIEIKGLKKHILYIYIYNYIYICIYIICNYILQVLMLYLKYWFVFSLLPTCGYIWCCLYWHPGKVHDLQDNQATAAVWGLLISHSFGLSEIG